MIDDLPVHRNCDKGNIKFRLCNVWKVNDNKQTQTMYNNDRYKKYPTLNLGNFWYVYLWLDYAKGVDTIQP